MITAVVRNKLEEWNREKYQDKLKLIEIDDFDKLEDYKDQFDGHEVSILKSLNRCSFDVWDLKLGKERNCSQKSIICML